MLSEAVNMYMYLSNANIYYALHDRTINLLIKGDVDMSTTTGEEGEHGLDDGGVNHSKYGFSDAEVRNTVKKEQEVEVFIVDQNKTSRWILLSIS